MIAHPITKKFTHLRATVSDEALVVIARVVSAWSALEMRFRTIPEECATVVRILAARKDFGMIAEVPYSLPTKPDASDVPDGLKKTIDHARLSLFAVGADREARSAFERAATEARRLYSFRNDLAHSCVAQDPETGDLLLTSQDWSGAAEKSRDAAANALDAARTEDEKIEAWKNLALAYRIEPAKRMALATAETLEKEMMAAEDILGAAIAKTYGVAIAIRR